LSFAFDHSLARDLAGFYAPAQAAVPPAPRLLLWNAPLAEALGLSPAEPDQLARWFSGAEELPGSQPLAMAYAGHQFGHFNPQLGDGRALLLGEVIAPDGTRRDVQLKGSGPTPYSRQGDGKSALGPALREYLMSEAMAALGVPTTRSLAVVATGEGVWREQPHPGGVLTRIAASHLRVGSFEWAAAHKGRAAVEQLTDYALQRHFPERLEARNRPLALLEAVCEVQAALVAKWMNVGFVHGVMNTDNVTISGETIDYGPCAYLDGYAAAQVFSSIDAQGRYAYANQPIVCRWNLYRLASALIEAIVEVDEADNEAARLLLDGFPARYEAHWIAGLRPKLGLTTAEDSDLALGQALFAALEGQGADFTRLFRALAASLAAGYSAVGAELTDPAALGPWWTQWQARLAREPLEPAERATAMDAVNPLYIARNHLTDAALTAAEAGDMGPFTQLLELVTHPYVQQGGVEQYAHGAPNGSPAHVTFCGT
jgi:serine/tyrosine/threonine adenylyltransferase